MKRIFQLWLLAFVAGAFLLTFGCSWWIHSSLAKSSAMELLRVKLEDARRQVSHTQRNLDAIRQLSDATALAKVRAFAYMIQQNPAILKQVSTLESIRKFLDVDELHVSDEKGILIASIPQNYVGYNMAASEQSAAFMWALTDRNFTLVQDPRPNGFQKLLFQYAGVSRLDKPGIVQIGYHATRIEEAAKFADVQEIAGSFRIGHEGMLRITPNPHWQGEVAQKFTEIVFKETVKGLPSLCLSITCGPYILTGNLPENEIYLSRNSVLQILVIANLILFGVIFLLVSNLLQKVVIKGIYSVNNSLEEITKGNLDRKVAVSTTSEFSALSHGINATVAALKKSIENEAKRLNAELEMGRTIQTSVLPADLPPNDTFTLASGMYAAKEVGGDFYDYFMIDEDHLAMLIADVSGKGITAALYMMNSKALLKELILNSKHPADAFTQANAELCRNNKAHMFLTAFLVVANLKDNTATCVNAGHNPPLAKFLGKDWEYQTIPHSLPLGVSRKASYKDIVLPLPKGTQIFLYTDGVTEAQNHEGKLFGEQRLKELLDSQSGSPAQNIKEVRQALATFAAGTPQSDDITMLLLEY